MGFCLLAFLFQFANTSCMRGDCRHACSVSARGSSSSCVFAFLLLVSRRSRRQGASSFRPTSPAFIRFAVLRYFCLLSLANKQPTTNNNNMYKRTNETARAEGGHPRGGADRAGEHDGRQGLRSGGAGGHRRVRRAAQGRETSEGLCSAKERRTDSNRSSSFVVY